MALGAEGINMGTRFMCTVEAPIHQSIKQAIVDAQEIDTTLLMRRCGKVHIDKWALDVLDGIDASEKDLGNFEFG
jgi:NAD(P)H-dependent flavin oxidoreductase YrpB (nitropropane dioxygenase family)